MIDFEAEPDDPDRMISFAADLSLWDFLNAGFFKKNVTKPNNCVILFRKVQAE